GGVAEGRLLQQLELGAVMSNLRTQGPGAFYDGVLGRSLVEAVSTAGGRMTLDDLRNYRPEIKEPIRFELGNNVLAFAPDGGGAVAAQVWAAASNGDRYDDTADAARTHLIVELGARAYQAEAAGTADTTTAAAVAALQTSVSETSHSAPRPSIAVRADAVMSGASIVAVDNQGRTVACSFTMNGPFGAGVIAPGTGILLAPLLETERASVPTVALMANEKIGLTFFAAAGAGPIPGVLARVALDTIVREDENMVDAVALPRAFNTGNPDITFVEATTPDAARAALDALGHNIEQVQSIGRVNGFFCPRGLPRVQTCQFVKDPRSFGLAVSSDE
ncbi:MAG: gamma-glutamyltransferase, partial [Alphaproteobacteria bacterium]